MCSSVDNRLLKYTGHEDDSGYKQYLIDMCSLDQLTLADIDGCSTKFTHWGNAFSMSKYQPLYRINDKYVDRIVKRGKKWFAEYEQNVAVFNDFYEAELDECMNDNGIFFQLHLPQPLRMGSDFIYCNQAVKGETNEDQYFVMDGLERVKIFISNKMLTEMKKELCFEDISDEDIMYEWFAYKPFVFLYELGKTNVVSLDNIRNDELNEQQNTNFIGSLSLNNSEHSSPMNPCVFNGLGQNGVIIQ